MVSFQIIAVKRCLTGRLYVCLSVAEYQNTLQWLCSKSALNDSADGATNNSADVDDSGRGTAAKALALRSTLRSFAHSTPWTMRLARLHAFLARHCSQYAQSCLAVHPPVALLNLAALGDQSDVSQPLIAVEYLGNLLTSADGTANDV